VVEVEVRIPPLLLPLVVLVVEERVVEVDQCLVLMQQVLFKTLDLVEVVLDTTIQMVAHHLV
jgi:hypothetical protein|tara:strand:- start:57 stop:242 length:186 start_codon:yes stop_codon:yes gene_type:complete